MGCERAKVPSFPKKSNTRTPVGSETHCRLWGLCRLSFGFDWGLALSDDLLELEGVDGLLDLLFVELFVVLLPVVLDFVQVHSLGWALRLRFFTAFCGLLFLLTLGEGHILGSWPIVALL